MHPQEFAGLKAEMGWNRRSGGPRRAVEAGRVRRGRTEVTAQVRAGGEPDRRVQPAERKNHVSGLCTVAYPRIKR